MNEKDFYTEHSVITHPGRYALYFDELPAEANRLCQMTQCMMLHFLDLPHDDEKKLTDLDLRYVEKMLEKMLSKQNSLWDARRNENKLIGCCRDFSLLFCAMLRQKKIPARVRFGFSTVHIPGFHHDQVLLEYWDAATSRWCLADARINPAFIKKYHLKQETVAHDIARDMFLTAGDAWRLCRAAKKMSHRFGTGIKRSSTGWWFIRNKLIQDFAALNKMELLPWDCWGMMVTTQSDNFMQNQDQVELLDRIAALTSSPDIDIKKITALYLHDERLKVPKCVYSDSFVSGARYVELS